MLQLKTRQSLSAGYQDEAGIDEKRAETIANVGCQKATVVYVIKALARILPELRRVVPYNEAVQAAGFEHHSQFGSNTEIPDITFKIENADQDSGEIKEFHIHR